MENNFCLQKDVYNSGGVFFENDLSKRIPYISGLISDNKRFIDYAIRENIIQSNSEKIYLINNPSSTTSNGFNHKNIACVRDRIACVYKLGFSPGYRMLCLWLGKLDDLNRCKLFLEIVRRCDFSDFDMFGQVVEDNLIQLPSYPNLLFRGRFKSFKGLTPQVYNAFIFTSKYDGIPNILLDAGINGIPIIAPAVGGVGELVNLNTGYLLPENPTVDDYNNAIKEISKNPYEVIRRANNMLDVILERHSWLKFEVSVENLTGYLDNIV